MLAPLSHTSFESQDESSDLFFIYVRVIFKHIMQVDVPVMLRDIHYSMQSKV